MLPSDPSPANRNNGNEQAPDMSPVIPGSFRVENGTNRDDRPSHNNDPPLDHPNHRNLPFSRNSDPSYHNGNDHSSGARKANYVQQMLRGSTFNGNLIQDIKETMQMYSVCSRQ